MLNNIEHLLEKYENGETSLKEEAQLKNYFSQETVAPHLEMYKPMFQYFIVNKKEQFTKDISLLEVNTTKKKFNFKWLSIAAVAVLMLSIFVFNPTQSQEDLITEADRADYENAKAALALVSQHLNKATAQVSYLKVINTAGTQVDYLKEINDPMGRIFNNN
ncbi:hypothetical protein [Lacinutrix sp. 5H-3-7-4]|uniref:hypothetical protein n=1 Tax=Lacinutrix sp. (strain 5H-3-7-4) TaxID=983544 RepID=UPI00020A3E57|nr:hypothetical protein [Lacinutrix sp. 5H-3-7-4]AEH01864.1 hypothetical protein Lacal_2018 [Lacinutrix sp. 5H-3-7-4]